MYTMIKFLKFTSYVTTVVQVQCVWSDNNNDIDVTFVLNVLVLVEPLDVGNVTASELVSFALFFLLLYCYAFIWDDVDDDEGDKTSQGKR